MAVGVKVMVSVPLCPGGTVSVVGDTVNATSEMVI